MKKLLLIIFLFASTASFAQKIEVALTFDDFPFVPEIPADYSRIELVTKLMEVLKKHQIEGAVAFVNASRVEQSAEGRYILASWIKGGHFLGNHTWSHLDLNKTSFADFIADIVKNHIFLKDYGQNFLPYFRFPFLHEGNTQEKRDSVRDHLFSNYYRIAQVTVDFSDWVWNQPFIRCLGTKDEAELAWLRESFVSESIENLKVAQLLSKYLFNRQIKHIALIHPYAMSVEQLDLVLTSWKARGVKFISMEEATRDPVYYINPNVVRDFPYTFLNQLRLMKGLSNPPEVKEIYQRSGEIEQRLEKACF